MATDQDKKDFAARSRNAGTGSPNPVKPFPRLADYLGKTYPRAIDDLKKYDEAVEEWRKAMVLGGGFPV